MTFKEWLRKSTLSESSVLKYEGAISGVMSKWAKDAELLDGSLSSLRSIDKFEEVATSLRALPIYQERNKRGHNMYNSALQKYAQYLSDQPESSEADLSTDIKSILDDPNTTETEKENLIKTRVGQGTYRKKLITYWQSCALTGYRDTTLLVASHIKPWSASSNEERLDPYNGLLLLPTLDKAFDSGFITFESSGNIRLSTSLQLPDLLGIRSDMRIGLHNQHQPYLEFHRYKVFRDT